MEAGIRREGTFWGLFWSSTKGSSVHFYDLGIQMNDLLTLSDLGAERISIPCSSIIMYLLFHS